MFLLWLRSTSQKQKTELKFMKIQKLDANGMSHLILALLFVVVFAIAGVGYMVAGNARPVDSDGKPLVAKKEPGALKSITCKFSVATPKIDKDKGLLANITIKNDTKKTISPVVAITLKTPSVKSGGYMGEIQFKSVEPGTSATQSLPAYSITDLKTKTPIKAQGKGYFVDPTTNAKTSHNPIFTCNKVFNVTPAKPATTTRKA